MYNSTKQCRLSICKLALYSVAHACPSDFVGLGVLCAGNHNKIQAETLMDSVLDQNVVDSLAEYLDFKERR